MRKIGFANVSEFSIDEELNIGVYNIGGVDYILLGGEFCAEGASPTSQVLKGFTDIVVNECFGDEVGNCLGYTKVARFKIL